MKPSYQNTLQNYFHCTSALAAGGRWAALLSALLLASPARGATTYTWVNDAGGEYGVAANWNPNTSVPGTPPNWTDIAQIGVAGHLTPGTVLYDQSGYFYGLTTLQIGAVANSTASLTLSQGTLVVTNTGGVGFSLGAANPSTGSFTNDGGTLVVARPSSGNLYYQDAAGIGQTANGTGTFVNNSGQANFLCGVEIGNANPSTGTFTVNGGTVVGNGWFGVGRQNNSSGTFNLTGGIMCILRNPSTDGTGSAGGVSLSQGNPGTSVANISGGALYCTQIRFNSSASANQSLNVSGGDIYVGYIGLYRAGAAASQNSTISGGTFHTADMVPVAAGSTIGDTNTIKADGTNWTWDANLPVNLTNSSFLVNGQSGPGYVTFAPEATRTITLNNVWRGVGGLVVNGPGIVALGAADTYTGGTTISQGYLQFNSGGSVVDPSLTVPSGSAIIFASGNAVQNFTNNFTGAGDVLVTGSAFIYGTLGHSGVTVVTNGTLALATALNNTSSVTVSNTGTLAGVGPIGAPVTVTSTTVQGAHLRMGMSPLNIPDTLTINNDVTLGAGTELDIKLGTATTMGGGVNDLLVVNGNLTIDSTAVVNIVPLQQLTAGTYVIATYTGSLTGTFNPSVTGLTRYGFVLDYSTLHQIKLNVTGSNASLVWQGATNTTWDVLGTSNWLNGANIDVFNEGDAVTFDDSATNFSFVLATTLYPASITVNDNSNYTSSATGSGRITGGTGITKNGTGTLVLASGNGEGNDFTGPVQINAGILQISGVNSLGATNGGTTVANAATLDINGRYPTAGGEPLVLQGAGVGGTNGALMNSGANLSQPGLRNVTLLADTLINTRGRVDFGNNSVPGGSFQGNGHTLTKIGSGQLYFYDSGDIGVGDINVLQGQLGFEGPNINMGDPAKTCTVVGPTGTIRFFDASSLLLDKHLVLTNGTTLDVNSGSNNFAGPITLWQTNTISVNAGNFVLVLNGALSGSGGFNKAGNGPLYLNSANNYTGPTLINAGSIILGAGGSIANTPLINLAASTVLDASAGSLSLGSGQTLAGSGSVVGDASAGSGAILAPGAALAAGTLTFNNNLSLNNATNIIKLSDDPYTIGSGVNDLISVAGSLTLSGVSTIQISPLGILNSAAPYTVLQYSGTAPSAANLQVVSSSPRYSVSLVDPGTTPSSLQVNITGNPGALVWKGGAASDPDIWDNTTTNWLNLGTGLRDAYISGDNAIFDDTGTVNAINVATTVVGLISMSNNAAAYTLTGNGLITAALDMEGTGPLTLAVSNAPAFSTITANSGTLIFDVQVPGIYTNRTPISDNGAGQGTLVKAGTNTLYLNADNTSFYGTIVVSNGVLQYTNNSGAALGYYTSPLYVTNIGSLDLRSTSPQLKNIIIAGDGFNGGGAVIDSSNAGIANEGIHNLTLAGDASVGASNRWDVYGGAGGGSMNGNGHKLTMLGPGSVVLNTLGETSLGDIHIVAGRLGFQGSVSMGDPSKTLTVESNATLTLYAATNTSNGNGFEDKVLVLNGNAIVDSGGVSNNFQGPITLVGTNNLFGLRAALHLWGGIGGSGGLAVGNSPVGSGSQTLWLDGANSYNGPTVISNAHKIVVGASSSLGTSSLIQVNSGGTLDVSAPSSFTLGAGQVLMGNGTVAGGSVVFGSGSTLAPGFPDNNTYTLTMNGTLSLQSGSTNVVVVNKTGSVANDTVAGLTSVTMGGTLVINNVGNPLAAGDAIQLFSASSGYNGGFGNVVPAAPGSGLMWDYSTLNTDGKLRVLAIPRPDITEITVGGGNVVLSGTNGMPNAYYSVLSTTNVALPLNQWQPLMTNQFDGSGNFNWTNAINPAEESRFYLLQLQ